jgi:hypothetical protein
MTRDEQRLFLLKYLLAESPGYGNTKIPADPEEQRRLLRALMNIRPAMPAGEEFLRVQDAYLSELAAERGITDAAALPAVPADPRLVLWRGDITTLRVDAIVNAANSRLEGCFMPCHNCIDN